MAGGVCLGQQTSAEDSLLSEESFRQSKNINHENFRYEGEINRKKHLCLSREAICKSLAKVNCSIYVPK